MSSAISPPRSVRRCLFGRPEPEETNRMLDKTLCSITKEKERKWCFDFERDEPLDEPGAVWQWETVDANDVPSFYKSRSALWPTPTKAIPNVTTVEEQQSSSTAIRKRPAEEDTPLEGKRKRPETELKPNAKRVRVRLQDFLPVSKACDHSECSSGKAARPKSV